MVALPALPTVHAMGRIALPLGSTLVAGTRGLGRPVRWARTSGVLSPLFPTLNADEVALLDLPVVMASNPGLTLARVVRELGRLGLSAIVVKGSADTAARREAERSNLPLWLLPEETDVARVARSIIRLVSDREAQEEAQAAALYRHLGQRVAAGAGLKGLVEEMHRLFGHAVRVSDLQGATLAQAGNAPPDSITLTRPLFVGESPVATLTLHDTAEALEEWSRVALEQGAAALALELVKIEAVEAAREGAQGDFVATLLAGEGDSLLISRARAADYPLDGTQWAVVAVAAAQAAPEEAMRGWLRRATARAEALGWQARHYLAEESLPPLDHAWQATLVLAGGSATWETSRATFLEHLTDVWSERAPFTVAAGDVGRGSEGLRRALAQASDALSLGLRLFGPGRAFLHREMGLYRLLRHLHGTDDLRQFLDSTLSALESYDREHETELVKTLGVLLEHGGNVSATAKAMHLHRNSLVYRVDRIREIAHLDPTKADDAFALKLALMLAPLR